MQHSNSEVSIDQVARLAGQTGVNAHQDTREFDRAALLAATNVSLEAARVSPARRYLAAVLAYLRG